MALFPWRRRKAGKKELSGFNSGTEFTVPSHFRCPISLDLMKDPVTLSTGMSYDRESIERWIESGSQICPVTNQELRCFNLIPNHTLRKMIQEWCVENRSHGVERIPTPRTPVTPYEVSEICSRIRVFTQRGDDMKCRESVKKIKIWAKESERNKRCIAENGAGYVLSASFEAFARVSMEKHRFLLEEILSILVFMFPLIGKEGQAKLGSQDSLLCLAWFLKGGDLSPKQHAVVTLKELLSLDQNHIKNVTKIEDVPESLFKIIKEPICPSSTKASLMVIYHMITQSEANENIISRFVDMGLVSLLIEILVSGERSLCEKALGVLDGICGSEKGREKARNHALAVPVVVKKLLRVSAMASERSVSILWKLCRYEGESAMVEALQVGGFQKVLVVLQVGCDEWTKVKATELLKLMNQYRDRLDCFDSSIRVSN